jgi:hypothetical protein
MLVPLFKKKCNNQSLAGFEAMNKKLKVRAKRPVT